MKRNKTKFELRKLHEEQLLKTQNQLSSAKSSKVKPGYVSQFEGLNPENGDSDIGSA